MWEIKTAKEFDEIIYQEKLVFVDMYAVWCGPCKMMAPILDKAEPNHPELKMIKLDVEQIPEIAEKYNIKSVPTFLLFNNGIIVSRYSGYLSEEKLNKFMSVEQT